MITHPLRTASAGELDALLALLREASLPVSGVAEHFPDGFLVAEDGEGGLAGAAGLEAYDGVGLLRSVVVRPDQRGTGLGQRLSRAVVNLAAERGLRELYLLTTTAEDFFPRLGFTRVERATLPPELESSAELRGACPASAAAMRLTLAD